MKDYKPSQRAFIAIRRLARKAAKTDWWMRPCFDSIDFDEDVFQQHRSQWEETEHFNHFYGQQLSNLAVQQARRFKVELDTEIRYSCFYQPLLDAFWDEWEETLDFGDLISQNTMTPAEKG